MGDFPEILTISRFYLELKLDGSDDRVDGVFKECSGFKVTQEVIEITEVTPQQWGQNQKARGRPIRTKIPGNTSYTNITLRRGLTISTTMWDWLAAIQSGQWSEQRRQGALIIYNQAAQEKFRLNFAGAWPTSYSISDVNVAGAEHEIEEVELVVEGLKRVNISS